MLRDFKLIVKLSGQFGKIHINSKRTGVSFVNDSTVGPNRYSVSRRS
jgi:hypothetical protein